MSIQWSTEKLKQWRGEIEREYTFLGRECKSTGIGKIEAEVFMSQEEIFIPRSDSWLSSRGLADDV